jgi:CRP/FNR family cyclic AMP-dependent transcriptional regulator
MEPIGGPSQCSCNKVPVQSPLSPMCIGRVWLFENLPQEELGALVKAAVRKTYARGESIFMQEEPADRMFLLKAGRVKLSKLLEGGSEITLDIRKAGDFLGETMLSEERSYPVGAWCLEETLTCGFTRERFEHLVLEHPGIGLQVMKNLSKRIAWLTHRVESMSLTNLEDRLYQVLLNVALEHGTRSGDGLMIQFPMTHEDLAFLVGAHRVSITRAMKGLRKSGSVLRQRKNLIVRTVRTA